jgi:hypothetical protein
MDKLIFFCALLSAPFICCAADTVTKVTEIPSDIKSVDAVIPIFSQKLGFRLPTSWKIASQKRKPGVFSVEFSPNNEDIKSWKNLLTIQGFENLSSKVTAEQFLSVASLSFRTVCSKDFVFENLGQTTIDGFIAHRAIMGCNKVPNQQYGEIAYWLIIQGEKDIYSIQKAIRSETEITLSKNNVDTFFSDFTPIQLCKPDGTQYECKK